MTVLSYVVTFSIQRILLFYRMISQSSANSRVQLNVLESLSFGYQERERLWVELILLCANLVAVLSQKWTSFLLQFSSAR